MKNRLISVCLAAALLLGLLPQLVITSRAITYSGTVGGEESGITWTLNTETGEFTLTGTGKMVISTDRTPWETYRDKIISVEIGSGITTVCPHAFEECNNLKRVNLPDSVTSIGGWAFDDCTMLSSVSLPQNLKTIGKSAFSGCKALTKLSFPKSLRKISDQAFQNSGLTRVVLPDQMTELGKSVFYNCQSLSSVHLPDTLPAVPGNTFSFCRSLQAVDIPETVTDIGTGAFYYSSVSDVKLPRNLLTIGSRAFTGCAELREIILPGQLQEIGADAFSQSALEEIAIPDSVSALGNGTFSDCQNLSSVKLSADLSEIPQMLFSNCPALTEVSIPENVLILGDGAFEMCRSLEAVELPASLTKIGMSAFESCHALQEIRIPDAVTVIGEGAFSKCDRLEKVTFSKTLKTIGESAFESCSTMQEAILPDTLSYIGMGAFCGCAGLTKLVLPKGIHTIPEETFLGCRSLTKVDLPESLTSIYENAFYCCSGLTQVTVPDSVKYIGEYALGYDWSEIGGRTKLKDFAIRAKAETAAQRYAQINDLRFVLILDAPELTVGNISSSGKIRLSWNPIPGAESYKVYRADTKDGPFKLMKTVTDGASYINTSAVAGKTYYYKIRAVSGETKSPYSNTVSRTCDLPRPVVTASNVDSSGKIKLTWEPVDGAVGYKVYRAESKDGPFKLMKTVTDGTSYTNTSIQPGQKYWYKVKAIHANTSANSAYSSVRSRTCDLPRPEVTITRTAAGKPKLTWKKVAGAVSYKVYRAESKDGPFKLMKTVTDGLSYTNTSAVKGKTYYYKVKAVHKNTDANSAYSTVKSITAK